MDRMLAQMLREHETLTSADKKNSSKELVQELALCGLSHAGFFKSVVFYGGTALRVFHGLDRFSEDLDFSLTAPDPTFSLQPYLSVLEREIRAYGLSFRVQTKEKTFDSAIRSAFLKGSTREHLLLFFPDSDVARSVSGNDVMKIKLEVDTNPPAFASFSTQYRLLPIPYEVALYDLPSLFAGKIHAILCRAWKNRTKGRDLYDYVFFLANKTPVNLPHLAARLAQSGVLTDDALLTVEAVRTMLCDRFHSIDYEQAKPDVLPFIRNPEALALWSSAFFCSITEALQAADSR